MYTLKNSERGKTSMVIKRTRKLALAAMALMLAASTWAADPAFRNGPNGLRIKDLKAGQGQSAAKGQVATMHFVAWIDEGGERGREFYNSRRHGQPVSFVIGTDGVMQGWNEGVLGMKPGGKRMLLVPPGMAYGKRKVEGIPENTSLMMQIELVTVED